MRQFLRSHEMEQVDFQALTGMCAELESRDPSKIESAITALEDQPAMRSALERRYLDFIRAHLRDDAATLIDMARVKVSPQVVELITQFAPGLWQFDGSLGDEAFSVVVDVAGSLVHTHFNLDQYISHHSDYLKSEGDFDYANMARGTLVEYLEEQAFVGLYLDGWYGAIASKLLRSRLEKVAFDHGHADVVNDARFLPEFLMFVLGCMESDELEWDFFQSEPPKFPSEIYALMYSWKFVVTNESALVAPPDFDEQFNGRECKLWVVER